MAAEPFSSIESDYYLQRGFRIWSSSFITTYCMLFGSMNDHQVNDFIRRYNEPNITVDRDYIHKIRKQALSKYSYRGKGIIQHDIPLYEEISTKHERFDIHHIFPHSLGGKRGMRNSNKIVHRFHMAHHRIFENMPLMRIQRFIIEINKPEIMERIPRPKVMEIREYVRLRQTLRAA